MSLSIGFALAIDIVQNRRQAGIALQQEPAVSGIGHGRLSAHVFLILVAAASAPVTSCKSCLLCPKLANFAIRRFGALQVIELLRHS